MDRAFEMIGEYIDKTLEWFEEHPRLYTIAQYMTIFQVVSIMVAAFMLVFNISGFLFFWLTEITYSFGMSSLFAFLIFPALCGSSAIMLFFVVKWWINRQVKASIPGA